MVHARSSILVVGSPDTAADVRAALPTSDLVVTANPLEAVWRSGRQHFDAVCISLATRGDTTRAVRTIRRLNPKLRIVLTCNAHEEPLARHVVEFGADDYLVTPIVPEEMAYALRHDPPHENGAAKSDSTSTASSWSGDVRIFEQVGRGVAATLQALAELAQDEFDAVGVILQIDDDLSRVGDASRTMVEEPICRNEDEIGRVAVALAPGDSVTEALRARLARFAKLVASAVGTAREIERWRHLAWIDDLSEIGNRRFFSHRMNDLIAQATRERSRLTVLLFDIDNFKHYNDQYGHDTGDALIREVALLLKSCSRDHDIVARYGGDEFAVIFWDADKPRVPGSKHPIEPMQLTERFRKAIAEHDFKCLGRGSPGPVTISGGIASFPWNGTTEAELMRAADAALLGAKRIGKNRIHLAGDASDDGSHPQPEQQE